LGSNRWPAVSAGGPPRGDGDRGVLEERCIGAACSNELQAKGCKRCKAMLWNSPACCIPTRSWFDADTDCGICGWRRWLDRSADTAGTCFHGTVCKFAAYTFDPSIPAMPCLVRCCPTFKKPLLAVSADFALRAGRLSPAALSHVYSPTRTASPVVTGRRSRSMSGTAVAAASAADAGPFPTLVSPEWLMVNLGSVKLLDASWALVRQRSALNATRHDIFAWFPGTGHYLQPRHICTAACPLPSAKRRP
jgi:hypothetical protein